MARYPNFDFLRLAAAISVIFSHAFLIAQGDQTREPLILLTGNQSILGLLGVFVFFFISGFLVTQSFESWPSPRRFLASRALRIFPGFAVCLLFCALIIGPIVTHHSLGVYFDDKRIWHFVFDNLAMQPSDEALPGVLFADNPVGLVVNGTLWSLRYEIYCYLMVLILGLSRLLTLRTALLIFAATFLINALSLADPIGERFGHLLDHLGTVGGIVKDTFDLAGFLWLVPFFAAGMLLYYWGKRARPRLFLAILTGIGIVISAALGKLLVCFALFGAYPIIYLATSPQIHLPRVTRFGDLSYGLYIYGWPAEEMVMYATGGKAPWFVVFGLGLTGAIGLALLSWHLVEKPALRRKPRQARPAGSEPPVPATVRA